MFIPIVAVSVVEILRLFIDLTNNNSVVQPEINFVYGAMYLFNSKAEIFNLFFLFYNTFSKGMGCLFHNRSENRNEVSNIIR